MRNRAASLLTVVAVLVGLVVPARVASSGSAPWSDDTLSVPAHTDAASDQAASVFGGLGYWLDASRSLGLGMDVSRIQPNISSKLPAPATVADRGVQSRLIDTNLHFDAISFVLRLRWPTLARESPPGTQLQPYVSVGPALFVARPDDLTVFGALPSQNAVSLSVGMMGGAGLSWQLSENASVFGEYRFTQPGSDKLLPLGGRGTLGRDANTSDLLYGISVRF